MPIIAAKGYTLSLEAFLVFLGWMLVLSFVWQHSSEQVKMHTRAFEQQRLMQISLGVSDALILNHHVQPWKGCAVVDDAKQRVLSYVLDSDCLLHLNVQEIPSSLLAKVSLFSPPATETIYFWRKIDANAPCFGVRRPVFLSPAQTLFFLEVLSCA